MLLDAVATILGNAGVGVVGSTIFKGNMPDSPNSCIAIYEYASQSPERVMGSTGNMVSAEIPAFQICVRGDDEHKTATSYVTARNLIDTAFRALDGYSGTIESSVILSILAVGAPEFLKRDENFRPYFVCNFDCTKVMG
jgi:hypothetical protein